VEILLDFVVGTLPVNYTLVENWILADGQWWMVYTPQTA
jgi:hypothetical protein